MTEIYFNGGDGEVLVKKLTLYQNDEYISYKIETMNGVVYHSPMFKSVK